MKEQYVLERGLLVRASIVRRVLCSAGFPSRGSTGRAAITSGGTVPSEEAAAATADDDLSRESALLAVALLYRNINMKLEIKRE